MIYLIGLLLAFGGFVLACAAMQRHQPEIFGARLSPAVSRRLRFGGAALIVLCWLIDGFGYGWGMGAVTALGHLTLAALLAIATLHWRAATRRKAAASQR